jgi:hypothetical protein
LQSSPDSNAVGIEKMQPVRWQIDGHAGAERDVLGPDANRQRCVLRQSRIVIQIECKTSFTRERLT